MTSKIFDISTIQSEIESKVQEYGYEVIKFNYYHSKHTLDIDIYINDVKLNRIRSFKFFGTEDHMDYMYDTWIYYMVADDIIETLNYIDIDETLDYMLKHVMGSNY